MCKFHGKKNLSLQFLLKEIEKLNAKSRDVVTWAYNWNAGGMSKFYQVFEDSG